MRTFHKWFTWYMLILAFAVAFLAPPSFKLLNILFSSLLFFMAGIVGLWAAAGHLLASERTAASIGWATSPFQQEKGFTNLSIGIAGILAPWHSLPFQFCLMLILSILWWGCAYVHIKDLIEKQNKATHNAGPMLYTTILTPPLLWLIYCYL